MPGHDIVVVGASAGGVEALMTLVRGLPLDLPAAVFVVLHIPAQSPSLLPDILNRVSMLNAKHAVHNETIQPGQIYVASPDHHLIVERDRVLVVHGPKENRHRPAVDVLFRTAARAYGPRVIGVILTGSLDDGTAGLQAIKMRGGLAVVQDPADALYPSMPLSASENVAVDWSLPLAEIGPKLVQLVAEPVQPEAQFPVPEIMDKEARIVEMDAALGDDTLLVGPPSNYSCPECGGVLHELQDGSLTRFRCRVGHAFSFETMLAEQSEALEVALWSALNTLEESVSLSRRMMRQAQQRGNSQLLIRRLQQRVAEAEQRAAVIRRVLVKDETIVTAEAGAPGAQGALL